MYMEFCLVISKAGLDRRDENHYRLNQATMEALNRKPASQPAAPKRIVSSELLLGGRRELVIVHNGREYRLQLTQNGKLILTA